MIHRTIFFFFSFVCFGLENRFRTVRVHTAAGHTHIESGTVFSSRKYCVQKAKIGASHQFYDLIYIVLFKMCNNTIHIYLFLYVAKSKDSKITAFEICCCANCIRHTARMCTPDEKSNNNSAVSSEEYTHWNNHALQFKKIYTRRSRGRASAWCPVLEIVKRQRVCRKNEKRAEGECMLCTGLA